MIEPKYERELHITETVDLLERFWLAHPELRLGQILANAAKIMNDVDPFFLEDASFAYALGVMEAQYQMGRESAEPPPA